MLRAKCDDLSGELELGQVAIGAMIVERHEAEEKLKSARLLASKELELQNEKLKA